MPNPGGSGGSTSSDRAGQDVLVGIADVDQGILLVAGHPSSHFRGERPETVVAAAERALGLTFPPSYRRFIERLGAGSIGGLEIYGVTEEPFDGPIPDGVWATLDSRSGPSKLPATMVVIGDDGMGGEYVLDTATGSEPPVEVWNGGASRPGDPLEQVGADFGSFFLDEVRLQVAKP